MDGRQGLLRQADELDERARGARKAFAASLPIEQIAEAWSDFRGEVDDFNRVRWSEESDRRERQRDAEEELIQARREQRGTSRLLD
jgi:hypothetical protein